MEKQLLRCDICGGELEMSGGGKAVCTSCGMKYSTESLREKFNGLKVSVTGSKEDVEQWRVLLQTYLEGLDFEAAEGVVKKILEAIPNDIEANKIYSDLQTWKHLEVIDGVLVRYKGMAKDIVLPDGIIEIGHSAFGDGEVNGQRVHHTDVRRIVLSKTVKRIDDGYPGAFLNKNEYSGAFLNCKNLEEVILPEGLKEIGAYAFSGCSNLSKVTIPTTVERIGKSAFEKCFLAFSGTISLPNIVSIKDYAFYCCGRIEKIEIGDGLQYIGEHSLDIRKTILIVYDGQLNLEKATRQIEREQAQARHQAIIDAKNRNEERKQTGWRDAGLCQYCGGSFRGWLSRTCSVCGKAKDY